MIYTFGNTKKLLFGYGSVNLGIKKNSIFFVKGTTGVSGRSIYDEVKPEEIEVEMVFRNTDEIDILIEYLLLLKITMTNEE
jgi:hypothetical protein